jgi:hypothetical protein
MDHLSWSPQLETRPSWSPQLETRPFPVTSVGDSALHGPFYLNNVLVIHDIIQIFYMFVVLPLTINVTWSLTYLAFL